MHLKIHNNSTLKALIKHYLETILCIMYNRGILFSEQRHYLLHSDDFMQYVLKKIKEKNVNNDIALNIYIKKCVTSYVYENFNLTINYQ